MIRPHISILLALGGLLLGMATSPAAAEGIKAPTLTLQPAQERYVEGEAVDLILTVVNPNDQPLTVLHPAVGGVCALQVLDAEQVMQVPVKVAKGPAPEARTWQLAPQEVRTYTFKNLTWNGPDTGWNFSGSARLRPSKYRVFMTFTSPPAGPAGPSVPEGIWQGKAATPFTTFFVLAEGQDTLTCPNCRGN